jgi:hypothetical protein
MRQVSALVLAIPLALIGAAACPAASGLPPDLDLVPRAAAGFVHLRAADLWRSPWAQDVRYLVDRAGPEAWKTFVKKCPLDPATLDRITLILPTPQALNDPFPTVDPEAVSVLVVVHTRTPYARLPLIQTLGPREKVYRQHLYYFNEDLWSGLALIDEQTFVIGSEDALVRFFELSLQPNPDGPLRAALEEAAGKHLLVVGLNPTLLGKEKGAEMLPPSFKRLLAAHGAVLSLDLDEGIRLEVRLDYPQDDQAREGEKDLRATFELGRQGLAQPIAELEKMLRDPDKASPSDLPGNFGMLVALGFMRELDGLLKDAPIARQGRSVKADFRYHKLDSVKLLAVSSFGLILLGRSAMATFSMVGDRIAGPGKDPVEEHLRTLAQALDKYHDQHGTYPPPVLRDREGRPVLSWRVALLPYLGEEALYSSFRLDEPWDSLHNKRLLKKLPRALQVAGRSPGWGIGRFKTPTQVFTGSNTLFGPKGVRKDDVARPAILLLRLADDEAVYWTKPADLAYAADRPVPNLFGKHAGSIKVLLTDGTYRNIDKSIEDKTLRALIERGDARPGDKTDRRQAGDLESVWKDLGQNDEAGTRQAWQEIATLIHTPERTVPFVKDHVKPVPRPDARLIARCLTELDSRNFKTRDKAMSELERLGELAVPAIEKKLRQRGLPEESRRRMQELVERPKTSLSGAELRTVRAIEVLASVGGPEARAVLDELAGGADGAVITEQARKAVGRLTRRSDNR